MKIIYGGISNKRKRQAVVLILLLVASLTVLFSAVYQSGKEKSAAKADNEYLYDIFTEDGSAPSVPAGSNAATVQSEKSTGVLLIGRDFDSNRTDAIICVYFDGENERVSTLQIPRDTYVIDGDYKGRINNLLPRYKAAAQEAGATDPLDVGIKALMAKINADFGIRLDNYVFLDVSAVSALTDALGGVNVDIPADIDYTDTDRGIDLHLKEGVQRLDGKTAAMFVRYRQGYPQADLGRINAQKLYAAAMLDKLMSFKTLANATTVAEALASYVKTDLSAEQIVSLTARLCLADRSKFVMYTLPGNGVTVNGASYYGTYKELLAEVVCKGFYSVSALALEVPDFYATVDGGYTDTDGIKLSSVIDYGISIPVYAG